MKQKQKQQQSMIQQFLVKLKQFSMILLLLILPKILALQITFEYINSKQMSISCNVFRKLELRDHYRLRKKMKIFNTTFNKINSYSNIITTFNIKKINCQTHNNLNKKNQVLKPIEKVINKTNRICRANQQPFLRLIYKMKAPLIKVLNYQRSKLLINQIKLQKVMYNNNSQYLINHNNKHHYQIRVLFSRVVVTHLIINIKI
ncbi:transmembrane protein, putative (macronuclear) [Tetrahymena thermophila SB210]|uniref:Transmembrane protein, putative n=1 Tax=Tetrahymena thermophila (strain SB210) TaxID=312017 RepID=W7WZY0_TETTS|nr:transmembrane protein, putative [Tetrahymena thermophila SB210]EWS71167.1 transmembrane protein, putative [Tetrahymena thermophila SB210]|eukprot:XP_012656308.1 transmembrane protein, putative [Tetrahymena thermophila SB210]